MGSAWRSIARESRVTTSSILHHFGNRARLLRIAAHRTGRARLQVIERRAAEEGLAAFLPLDDDEEDLITARAWLAWCELGRCDSELSDTITDLRDEEYALLARTLGVPLRTQSLIPLMALVDGLLVGLCAPTRPLTPALAREVLLGQVDGGPLMSAG